MIKNLMAIVAGVGLALAPVSSVLAETVTSPAQGTTGIVWIPANAVEQQAARGGGGYKKDPIMASLRNICIFAPGLPICPNRYYGPM